MIAIKHEQPEHLDGIRRLLAEAFPTPAEAELVDDLRTTHSLPVSLVAIDETGDVIGHIAFSPVRIAPPLAATPLWGLAPLAVAEDARGSGLGSELVREGLRACAERPCGGVLVLGDPAFYQRFGFRPSAEWGLRCQFDAPAEAFMLMELHPHACRAYGGIVSYHPAFDRFLSA